MTRAQSDMKPESSQHFASPKTCDAQGSAVEILDDPSSFQRDFQQGRPQRPADVRPSLTPIQAGARESAAQSPSRLDVDAQGLKRLRPIRAEIVGIVRCPSKQLTAIPVP